MLLRKTVLVLALASAAVPAVFANSGVTWSGADGGNHVNPQRQSRDFANRADVEKEATSSAADRSTLVTVDGSKDTVPQHGYAFRGGKLIHTDSLSHTSKQSQVMPRSAQNFFTERYGP